MLGHWSYSIKQNQSVFFSQIMWPKRRLLLYRIEFTQEESPLTCMHECRSKVEWHEEGRVRSEGARKFLLEVSAIQQRMRERGTNRQRKPISLTPLSSLAHWVKRESDTVPFLGICKSFKIDQLVWREDYTRCCWHLKNQSLYMNWL